MSTQEIEAAAFEGRGDWVTAITAILNLNDTPFEFAHRKYPHYNRIIQPGFFRYPYGTTAPIAWSSHPNDLIKFGEMGSMWQRDKHVYYKIGGNPVNDFDGEVVYTRQSAIAGEQYLILGVKGNQVRTLKSYTPGEALLNNVSEAVLTSLNILKPDDYGHLSQNAKIVEKFGQELKRANDAGQMANVNPRCFEAISKISYQDFDKQLQKLSAEQREQLQSGSPSGWAIASDVLNAVGVVAGDVAQIAGIVGAFLGAMAIATAVAGPAAWVTVTKVLGILSAISLVVAGIAFIMSAFFDILSLVFGLIDKYSPKPFVSEGDQMLMAS